MRFTTYARNAILYTVLFSLLATTTPAPVVYAAPVTKSQEQTEENEKSAVSQIRKVQKSNKTLLDSITALDKLIQEKAKEIPEDTALDETYTMLYSDYTTYKDTVAAAKKANEEATAFTNGVTGDPSTIGSTKALTNLLSKYIGDTTAELEEDDRTTLETLSQGIATQQANIDAINQDESFENLKKYHSFSLADNITTLNDANEQLKAHADVKRPSITEENEKLYTPATYKPYKDTINEADILYEATSKLISRYDEAVKDKKLQESADTYTITDEENLTYIKETLAQIAIQLEKVITLTDKVSALDPSTFRKQEAKIALKKAIDDAAKYPPDIYTTYTPETYSVFQKCLADAQHVYDDGDATRDQIRTAKEALLAAIKGLVEVDRAYSVIGNTYYYNVNDFGAFGTDNEDDTHALQKALDQARDGVNIVITVPAGTYYISDVLYIQSNTSLNLDANATIYRSDSSLSNNMLKNSDAKHKSTGYKGYKLSQNITVTGGTWNGGNIYSSTKSTNLIYIGHADNVKITNTTIKNCHGSHALEFAGVQNGLISNCDFSGFRFGKNSYTSEAIQLDICYKSGSTKWTPGFTLDKTTCRNITIEYCTIEDYPRGIGSHHALSGVPYENIKIRNNTITRNSSTAQSKCVTGIFIMGAKNIKINKNTVDGYSYGIWVRQSSKIAVKKNTLRNNPIYSIQYDGNDAANKYVKFTVTKYKVKTKPLTFSAPTIKKGTMKTRGQTYKIKKVKKSHSVTLKKNLKKKQKISFFGMDKDYNKIYRTYYVGK